MRERSDLGNTFLHLVSNQITILSANGHKWWEERDSATDCQGVFDNKKILLDF